MISQAVEALDAPLTTTIDFSLKYTMPTLVSQPQKTSNAQKQSMSVFFFGGNCQTKIVIADRQHFATLDNKTCHIHRSSNFQVQV